MDDFGVLVQTNYGIKPQGKSAPMAASKMGTQTHTYNNSANLDSPTRNSNSEIGSFLDQNDILGFSSSSKHQNSANSDVFDDVFQVPINGSSFSNGGSNLDLESMFKGSMNLGGKPSDVNDEVIWGFSGKNNGVGGVENNDLLSSDPVDDFLGNLGKMGSNKGKKLDVEKEDNLDSDVLIPGFGKSNAANDRAQPSSTQKSAGLSSLEELEDFAMGGTKKKSTGHLGSFAVKSESKKMPKQNSFEPNFIDILDDDSAHQRMDEGAGEKLSEVDATDLDSFFRAHTPKPVPIYEDLSTNKKTEEIPNMFSGSKLSTEKKVPPKNLRDDFSAMFEGFPVPSQVGDIEGKTFRETTDERVARALADMKHREFKAQQEQEERHRIAEVMDAEMKQWARGKDGNLRALLSSLQQVLGPELGWQPVGLTDLITSSQVKSAYMKAALCVHPDKVQQKGASLQQKFVAEKVFDLLKEARNKFNSEELR